CLRPEAGCAAATPPHPRPEAPPPPLRIRRDGKHPTLDPNSASTTSAHRSHNDCPTAVDVPVEQRMQRHHRIVVLGGRVDEVDHDPGLLARVSASDPADSLLIDP